jgi:hypothetical protein
MADYPMTPLSASTPNPASNSRPDQTTAHTRQLLMALAEVPRDELPNGPDREALAQLIRMGFVDNLYTPIGHAYHNIAWTHRPAWMDPRERISEWVAARRAWEASGGKLSGVRTDLAQREGGDA